MRKTSAKRGNPRPNAKELHRAVHSRLQNRGNASFFPYNRGPPSRPVPLFHPDRGDTRCRAPRNGHSVGYQAALRARSDLSCPKQFKENSQVILFLDFDGVLHPEPPKDRFGRVPLIWALLRARPRVEVVFSTSWRELYPFDVLVKLVTAGGGEELAPRFIGTTPVLPKNPRDHYRHRELECLAWLAANQARYPIARRPLRWIALDDMVFWFTIPCWQLYAVDARTGLTEADLAALLKRIPESVGFS